jgi:antitoxin component YwqK of YwqJK toxin-antitoxin module
MSTRKPERKYFLKHFFTLCCLAFFLTTCITGKITRTIIHNPDETYEFVFYKRGKEIAKQTVDGSSIIKTTGIIPDGIVTQYYDDGALFGEWNYENGKLEGISRVYYKSGELRLKWNYKDNKREGITEEYYQSGKLASDLNYKNDKLEGITKIYYESSVVKALSNYRDGVKDGATERFYEDGKLQSIDTYKDGKLQSIITIDEE